MIEIRKTEVLTKWLDDLTLVRIERLAAGNLSDAEPVGEGVSEL